MAKNDLTKDTHKRIIYKIENIKNSNVYIGQTKDFQQRVQQHKTNLLNNNHHQQFLQQEFNNEVNLISEQHKTEDINLCKEYILNTVYTFQIIAECYVKNPNDILLIEDAYILKYRNEQKGYFQKTNKEIGCKQIVENPLGQFFFLKYNNITSDNNKYWFRFIYLCSFMDYNNYIRWGKAKGNNNFANKNDLQEILMLENKQFYKTFNYFIDNDLLIEEQYMDINYYKINPTICKRGHLENSRGSVIKLFNNGVQQLYKHTNTKQHKSINTFLKLIPYIHYQANIICSNPYADIDKIKPLNLTEATSISEYSSRQMFKNALLELKLDNDNLIKYIKKEKTLYINPYFCFNGNDGNEAIKLWESI